MKKWDLIVLSAEVTDVFKSFLGCNRSCLDQDHRSILAEAVWSAGRQDKGSLVVCVSGRRLKSPNAGWTSWLARQLLASWAEEGQHPPPLPSHVPFRKPPSSLFSPRLHVACRGFGACLNRS